MIPDIPYPPARLASLRGPKAFPPYPGPYLEEGGLEGEWLLALGANVKAAAACAPLSIDLLSPEELAAFRGLCGLGAAGGKSGPRGQPDPAGQRAWLTERAALYRLRKSRGPLPESPSGKSVSVGFAGGLAIAVACTDAAAGLGVGLACDRPVPSCMAPFFLSAREAEWAAMRADESAGSDRLRLWTIKAALAKADSESGGGPLSGYRLADPGARRGKAESGDGKRFFRYVSHKLAGWRLSLAIRKS